MAKKPTKPFRMPVLQRFKVRPIEDPAEQAALDERIKRSLAAAAASPTTDAEGRESAGDGPADVVTQR